MSGRTNGRRKRKGESTSCIILRVRHSFALPPSLLSLSLCFICLLNEVTITRATAALLLLLGSTLSLSLPSIPFLCCCFSLPSAVSQSIAFTHVTLLNSQVRAIALHCTALHFRCNSRDTVSYIAKWPMPNCS